MPEIKHQFTGGKMDKDTDERLVKNGQYRDAMNIQVATSEGSDVATAQNILGNARVGNITFPNATVVAALADEKVDTLYWFVTTPTVDYIVSYVRNAAFAEFIFVDIDKDVLKFDENTIITGINIIDDMIFWTDARTEPKKINVNRCRQGTNPNGLAQTLLINGDANISIGSQIKLEEKHLTVIKRTPIKPMGIELVGIRLPHLLYTGVLNVEIDDDAANTSDLGVAGQLDMYNFSGTSIGDTITINIDEYVDNFGVVTTLPNGINDFTGWHTSGVLEVGTKLVLKQFDAPGNPPAIPITDYTLKCEVVAYDPDNYPGDVYDPTNPFYLKLKVTSISGYPPIPDLSIIGQTDLQYAIDLFTEEDKLFEFKFPRFSYRYKYEDGEYSSFAPFTQVCFLPGSFDYHPRKGYNLGMTNTLESVKLTRFIDENTPKDVVAVDILFKDEPSSVIYVVDTISANDSLGANNTNNWLTLLSGEPFDIYRETVNNVVPSNQLLRPWDNVPRSALAQDVTGNRIVYANYLQGYNLNTSENKKYSVQFNTGWGEFPVGLTEAAKSCKTLREYQLGMVFTDQYGRETPVISNHTGTIKLEKDRAANKNRIEVQLSGNANKRPGNVSSMKFFVKETSNEYYNMAMDRWYHAEDGNIWLSFPSSDRNKLDIDTFLILKKGSDQDVLVTDAARYKVLAIENEAPDFIKTIPQLHSEITHFSSGTTSQNISGTGGAGTGDLFGANLSQAPLQGENEFKINYQPYHPTPGKLLHEYKEGDLFIEFGKLLEDEVSQRYKVSSITCTFDEANPTNSTSGGPSGDDTYNISVENAFDSDVNFITDSPSGIAPTQIVDGTIVSFYKYKPRNLPQFDGRFFVKIYMDDTFRANIEKSYNVGLKYRVDNEESLYYMREDWFEQFTQQMGWWFTPNPTSNNNVYDEIGKRGYSGYSRAYSYKDNINNGTTNFWGSFDMWWDDAKQVANYGPTLMSNYYGPGTTGLFGPGGLWWTAATGGLGLLWADLVKDMEGDGISTSHSYNKYGHYENDKYCAASLFFRRYKMQETLNTGRLRWRQCYYDPQPGSVDRRDKANWTRVGDAESEERAGIGSHFKWYNWRLTDNVLELLEGDHSYFSGLVENAAPFGMDWNKFISVSRDAQTWFVDNGRAQGSTTNHDLLFNSSITANGHDCNKTGAAGGPRGVESPVGADSWSMAIGFGGIFGAQNGHDQDTSAATIGDTGVSFWGVGGWQGETMNPFTDELQQIVGNLNPGEKFKFKEDPLKTVYTFSPIINAKGYLNHSTKIGVEEYGEPSTDFTPFEEQRKHKDGASMSKNMEPTIPHNFRRTWEAHSITPAIQEKWNPFVDGEIWNGIKLELTICNSVGDSTSTTGTVTTGNQPGPDGNDVSIFVTDIYGTNTNPSLDITDTVLHEGMALKSYVTNDTVTDTSIESISGHTTSTINPHSGNDYLAIRKIVPHYDDGGIVARPDNVVTHYELILGGYNFPMQVDDHSWLQTGNPNNNYPRVGQNYTFVQVGANGHNANTEFNINHCGYELSQLQQLNGMPMGKITAVGPRFQLISEIQPLEVLSENPAIWETEPKESKDLDIYYEASGAIPISVNPSNIHEAIPIGSIVRVGGDTREVLGYSGMNVTLDGNVAINVNSGTLFTVIRPDGLQYQVLFAVKNVIDPNIISLITSSPIFPENLYNAQFKLAWHNCYSFGNGVESNRIRDNYNLPFISNGVKVSTTLENEYKEEHRKYGLIYSGIYNSVAGVNNLNQFIQAEKITKDINPIYGSIQKLHSRDSDLVTLCEDKCLRILANKDAVFNADGNTNLTATENVLGQTIPFKGEYGISTNPESFASEAYRAYFADRVRGTVMRLSMDGLTPISDSGMHDWFRDNLKLVYQGKIIGSYDDRNEEYNIKLETYPGGNPFGGGGGLGVWGCTNSLASNYDPLATIDDGTCILCSPNNFSATDVALLDSCCGKCDEFIDPLHGCYDFCNSNLALCCDNHCENASIGVWDASTSYDIGDVVEMVFQSGSYYYVAVANVPSGQTAPGYVSYPIQLWDECCTFYDQSPSYGPCNQVQPYGPCDDGGNGIPLCDISNATTFVSGTIYLPGEIVLHQGVYYSHSSTGGGGVPGEYSSSGDSKWVECCDTTDGDPCDGSLPGDIVFLNQNVGAFNGDPAFTYSCEDKDSFTGLPITACVTGPPYEAHDWKNIVKYMSVLGNGLTAVNTKTVRKCLKAAITYPQSQWTHSDYLDAGLCPCITDDGTGLYQEDEFGNVINPQWGLNVQPIQGAWYHSFSYRHDRGFTNGFNEQFVIQEYSWEDFVDACLASGDPLYTGMSYALDIDQSYALWGDNWVAMGSPASYVSQSTMWLTGHKVSEMKPGMSSCECEACL